MKRGVVLFVVIFLLQTVSITIFSCKKGSGILGPGHLVATPTPTMTPDVNFSVYIHQEGMPVRNLRVELKNEKNKIISTTNDKGIAGFKVNEHGKWDLLVNSFDDFSNQIFYVEPTTNTFFAVDYGIPTLELNLESGSETIPISPVSITYTVKYHTKFERKKDICIDLPNGISKSISYPYTVAKDGDELTMRLDIGKSFEGYNSRTSNNLQQYFNFYVYASRTATENKITMSNIRSLTKDWMFNVTVDYYFMTLFAHDIDDAKTCYYAGIRNIDVGKSYKIPFYGMIKCETKEMGIQSATVNMVSNSSNTGNCMPDFTSYGCCQFSYGCFDALAKIRTERGEQSSWRDDMETNGYIKVRFYDDAYLDVVREFRTNAGWSRVYYHWCCTSKSISRASCTCKDNVSESCIAWYDDVKCADITRYRSERINVTE